MKDLTANDQGSICLITDANDATKTYPVVKGDGYAWEENGRVHVNGGNGTLLNTTAAEWSTPSGTAAAVASALNSSFFLSSSEVLVSDESGLPALSGGKITLVEDRVYRFTTKAAITNDIDPNGAVLLGYDRLVSGIYFSAGKGFVGTDAEFVCRGMELKTPTSGSLFSFTGGATTMVLKDSTITGCNDVGDIGACASVTFIDVAFIGNTDGFDAEPTAGFIFKDCYFDSANTGTQLTVGGSPQAIDITDTAFIVPAGTTGFDHSGATPTSGNMVGNHFISAGGTLTSGTRTAPTWYVRSKGLTDV